MKILSLVPAALLAFALPADEVTFTPEEGEEVRKTFTFEATLDVTSQSMSIDGNDMGGLDEEVTQELSQRIVVIDRYETVADGRPTALHREFDTLSSRGVTIWAGDENEGEALDSDLAGEGVVFTWDADAEAYDVDWDENSDADDDLLDGLLEDMDYRALLPADEVEEGAEWTIDAEAFRSVMLPGGDLAIGRIEPVELPETEGGIMISVPEPPQDLSVWLQELDGEVTATFAGMVEEDDLRLAVIEIEIGIDCSADMSEWFSTYGGMEYESADSLLTLEGEATLRWDLAAGRFHDFTLEADADVTFEATTSLETPGGAMELEFQQTMEGTVEMSATVGEE